MKLLPVLGLGATLAMLVCASATCALPDGRAYEVVSAGELDGASPGSAVPAISGNAVDFQAEPFGDAATGGQTLYQAERVAGGDWQTRALTPKDVVQPKAFAQTAALFFTPELTQTIFATEQPFAPGDQDEGAIDLYAESPAGTLTWVSQGSEGGTGHDSVTYDGAAPNGDDIAFDTAESLVPPATGLEETGSQTADYLYVRDISTGQTYLVDVDDEGKLLNPEGAILGNGNYIAAGYLPADYYGTTTHAISADGSKIFFESPPPGLTEQRLSTSGGHEVHLYMRKDNSVTVPLDDPEAHEGAGARYMGASANGEFVFFLSDEGLAGNEFKDTELYVYDTESEELESISVAPEGSPSVDGAVDGVTAISNDGSHVYYVARGKLATNVNNIGQEAVEGRFNLYVYDMKTHANTFITQLGEAEVEPSSGRAGRLVSYLDVERPAVPTPNGDVLVFVSDLDLTGQNSKGTSQVYRYDAVAGSLVCISCSPTATGGSSLGIDGEGPGGSIGGGSYDPPGESAPMSETGEQIFFETENTLVPEDQNGDSPPSIFNFGEAQEEIPTDVDVYEWEHGQIYLISAGKPGLTTLQGVTPSGDDVFFDTNVGLSGQGPDDGMRLYDARVGGVSSIEQGEDTTSCTSNESCRETLEESPAPAMPGSATLTLQSAGPVSHGKPRSKRKTTAKAKRPHEHRRKKKPSKGAGKAHAGKQAGDRHGEGDARGGGRR
jgi:hypothetical protein